MVRFDDAIEAALAVVADAVKGVDTILVRDPTGVLTVVLPDDALAPDKWAPLAAKLTGALGRFSPGDAQVLLRTSDLIAPEDVLKSPDRIPVPKFERVWLVDRILTNQDWLRAPSWYEAPIPTATAYSIKGGVGRSTALVVLAWHLARKGRSVLVADLDLEAPGIGSMLLTDFPDYGVVDWCVEALSGQADAGLLEQSIAAAALAEGADGTIRVIPAVGRRTRDYVAKVGRAYTPVLDETGRTSGLTERLQGLITAAAQLLEPPDTILLDARAGLHDIGSAAVTQLGAEVFLFARDDAQTWEAYRRLFSHLRLAKGVEWGMPDRDLRWRLKMVAAQLEPTVAGLASWVDRSYSTWTEFYDEAAASGEAFERDEESAPHYPLRVAFDPRIRSMNLVDAGSRPEWSFVELAFGPFLEGASERLALGEGEPGTGT
jgi:hypothetical protein